MKFELFVISVWLFELTSYTMSQFRQGRARSREEEHRRRADALGTYSRPCVGRRRRGPLSTNAPLITLTREQPSRCNHQAHHNDATAVPLDREGRGRPHPTHSSISPHRTGTAPQSNPNPTQPRRTHPRTHGDPSHVSVLHCRHHAALSPPAAAPRPRPSHQNLRPPADGLSRSQSREPAPRIGRCGRSRTFCSLRGSPAGGGSIALPAAPPFFLWPHVVRGPRPLAPPHPTHCMRRTARVGLSVAPDLRLPAPPALVTLAG